MTTLDLNTLHLESGAHEDREQGVCLLEAVAWWAGEPHDDAPGCVSPVLAAYGRSLNDLLPDARRQELRRFVPLMPGTRDDGHDEARGYLALDWLVRTYTPAFLELRPELADVAAELRGMRRIADMAAAEAAGPVVRSAQTKARAAGDAAWAAAWAAAGAAAWAAAGDVAWDAAGDAAWAAAGAAAGDAAWAAAWAAARDALQPTVDQLQTSAIALLGQLIDPTAVTR